MSNDLSPDEIVRELREEETSDSLCDEAADFIESQAAKIAELEQKAAYWCDLYQLEGKRALLPPPVSNEDDANLISDLNYLIREYPMIGRGLERAKEAIQRLQRTALPPTKACAGKNCGSTDPRLHSADCFEEHERITALPSLDAVAMRELLAEKAIGHCDTPLPGQPYPEYACGRCWTCRVRALLACDKQPAVETGEGQS